MLPKWLFEVFRKKQCQVVVFSSVVVLLANINAIVDHFLHPEIPYFDHEHLIVGGVYTFVSSLLLGSLFVFLAQLETAMKTIESYENLLRICSYCKKIKIDNSDENGGVSWEHIESYLFEKAQMQFSHSVCPDCVPRVKADLSIGDDEK